MKKEIKFTAAYDKRHTDPNKDCGIHGVDMHWILLGEHGAVSWTVFTMWHLPHVANELQKVDKPMPADLSYHSVVRQNEWQTECNCVYLPTGKCYCDGSISAATAIFQRLLEGGDKAVWEALEERYTSYFGELK